MSNLNNSLIFGEILEFLKSNQLNILDEHYEYLIDCLKFLRKFENLSTTISEHGFHFLICPWSSNLCQEGPDTCACYMLESRLLRIRKILSFIKINKKLIKCLLNKYFLIYLSLFKNMSKREVVNELHKPSRKNFKRRILSTTYNHIKIQLPTKFKIGDHVRISKYKPVFEKGYTTNFTTEFFTIKKIKNTNPITYLLEDFRGNPIKGGFYELELQKTKFPDTYLVEKVLQKKNNQIFVKWLGFPSKYNSWISSEQLM